MKDTFGNRVIIGLSAGVLFNLFVWALWVL